jgi:hypothetical protein
VKIAASSNSAPAAGLPDIPPLVLNVNDGTRYSASCNVRTLRDKTRMVDEVIRSVPGGRPYDPRPFPQGLWRVTGVIWQKDAGFSAATYGPVKILTNAWQMVEVWRLDQYGDYLRETDELVRDEGYWLHYSESKTTLGCIRLYSPQDAVALARAIETVLRRGEVVGLDVARLGA